MVSKKIKFYFEYSSPYSYLSAYELLKLSQKQSSKIALEIKPVLLGVLVKELNLPDMPFKNNQLKFEYMWIDCQRQLKYLKDKYQSTNLDHDVNILKPPQFPINSILASRVTVLMLNKPEYNLTQHLTFINSIYKRIFSQHLSVDKIEDYSELLNKCYSIKDSENIIKDALSDENKLRLRNNVNEGVKDQVFGVPFFKFNEEIYWGSDRLPNIINKL